MKMVTDLEIDQSGGWLKFQNGSFIAYYYQSRI